jgi:hypothetical protein
MCLVIGKCFTDDYKRIEKNPLKFGAALIKGVNPSMFYIAVKDSIQIVGVIGISDKEKKCINPKRSGFIAEFGVIKGLINFNKFKKISKVEIPQLEDACIIEYACVLNEYRGKHIFSNLFKTLLEDKPYIDFYASFSKNNETYRSILVKKEFKTQTSTFKNKYLMLYRRKSTLIN